MTSESADTTPRDALQERLEQLRRRIEDPGKAQEFYELLSDEERQRVGPLKEAYLRCNGGLVGIWMQAKGFSRNRAIIEVAKIRGLRDAEYQFLLRGIGEAPIPDNHNSLLPVWKRDVFELWFDGDLIKRIQRPNQAANQICVLNAFQERGWQIRIDSPLHENCNLHDTLRRLNENRPNGKLERIRFERDGTGMGIRWHEIQTASPAQESLQFKEWLTI